jgi:23S rRNA-intervening sequence protein
MEPSPLFSRTHDFLVWLLPRTESFPRSQRFVVTKRLQDAALDFQELIVDAEGARGAQRLDRLRQADAALGKIRLYLRLCREWGWLTPGQYQHAAQMIAEMGRLLGGWIKTVPVESTLRVGTS